jgi:hypothetical protein
VDLNSASWNRLIGWLRCVDRLQAGELLVDPDTVEVRNYFSRSTVAWADDAQIQVELQLHP